VSGGHSHAPIHRPGDSAVHRLAPQCKLGAVLAFILIVVTTPPTSFWAFGGYAALLAVVATIACVPFTAVVLRMVVEVPFVAFAVLLPFISRGERVDVLGFSVSESGMLGAWNILAKASLGVVASILLAATTEPRTLLLGIERLHMPAQMVQIMQFMFRYTDVISSEMHRMRIARESRAFQSRDIRQLKVVAQSAGALFIRSYERGERVHLAMLSRGYDGTMPAVIDIRASRASWAAAVTLPGAGLVIAAGAWITQR